MMLCNAAILLPIYDISSINTSKLDKMVDLVSNLKLAGVDTISIFSGLTNNEKLLTYKPLVEVLKQYKLILINKGTIPDYLNNIVKEVIDIEEYYKKYEDENKIEELNPELGLIPALDIQLEENNIKYDENHQAEDEKSYLLDDILDASSNELDSKECSIPLLDGLGIFEENQSTANTMPVLDDPNSILMAMINNRKKKTSKSQKSPHTKKSSIKTSKKVKRKKILSHDEYVIKEITELLSSNKIVINMNVTAPPLVDIKKTLPKNALNITLSGGGFKLTLNNNKIKPSYINMEGVL
ncbi:hypothetical protein [Clostridium tertium]|uniref:hypothetical protein n=1 Tax=Clostridium tertium TaxID=1559 RepID=UPI0023B2ACB2|nr:hypothetical protein [Clostridium tertium]